MTRILLVLVILAATVAVLWSSWRLDRRLFAGVLALAVILLALFVGGFFQSQERAFVAIAAEEVDLELLRWRNNESGVRLEGQVRNNSDRAMARVSGMAVLRDCPDTESCREVTRVPLELRLHVPPGTTYPFNTVLRLDRPLPDHPNWVLRVEEARGYTKKSRVGG